MGRVEEGIALVHAGRREEARRLFNRLWPEVQTLDDAFQRCTLAHFMADVQDDPREELRWDLRALEAAELLDEERLVRRDLPLSLFYPSLHLNLADVYHRLGDRERARAHLAQATQSAELLPRDGYGRTIRGGISRLGERLAQ